MNRFFSTLALTMLGIVWALSAHAERLTLAISPPDFPPSNVCAPTIAQPNAIQSNDKDGSDPENDPQQFLSYLSRDIRIMTPRHNADEQFDFISNLITLRAEREPEFAGLPEAFQRVDLYLAAGRYQELRQRELIQGMTLRLDEMTNNQKVRLARNYLEGIGAAPKPQVWSWPDGPSRL